MARPVRIEFPGAVYHVTARGNRREPIFDDDRDRIVLLQVLSLSFARFDASCFAYCLMGNHYHLVLQTRRANLSRCMRHINGTYAQRYNYRHEKCGHLFQGRFGAILIDRDAYLMEACRYVDLNPVRAQLVARPQDWRWSSYRAHVGQVAPPPWLASDDLRSRIAPDASDRKVAARAYAAFVARGHDVKLWETCLRDRFFLGDPHFVERMRAGLGRGDAKGGRDGARAQRRAAIKSIETIVAESAGRDAGIAAALRHGYSQSDIARAIGLSASRISRIVARSEQNA